MLLYLRGDSWFGQPAPKHSEVGFTCIVNKNVQLSFTFFNDIPCSLDGLDVCDIEVDEGDVKVFLPELLAIVLSCKRSCRAEFIVLTQRLCQQFRPWRKDILYGPFAPKGGQVRSLYQCWNLNQ